MKRILVALAVLALSGAASAEDAKALFAQKCAACHGKEGKADTPMAKTMGAPDLTKAKLSAADAEKIIANGKGKMVAYKGKLTDAQIKELAAFVAGLKK
jgi:cytochrome c6